MIQLCLAQVYGLTSKYTYVYNHTGTQGRIKGVLGPGQYPNHGLYYSSHTTVIDISDLSALCSAQLQVN